MAGSSNSNSSGSIDVSDPSDDSGSDTDYEPAPKQMKLDEGNSSGAATASASASASTKNAGGYSPAYSDDVDDILRDFDPDEIPSDLEFSPPRPRPPTPRPRPCTPPMSSLRYNRERRNAIFEHRSPPPATQQQVEDEQFYFNELEVASVSDINENPIEDANSTSGCDDNISSLPSNEIVPPTPTASCAEPSDNFADFESIATAESDGLNVSLKSTKELNSSDSEISEKDKWYCTQCHAKTTPYLRLCSRCFQTRRNWLPKRPRSRRLKLRKRQEAERRASHANTSITKVVTTDSEADVVDGSPEKDQGSRISQRDRPQWRSRSSANVSAEDESRPLTPSPQVFHNLPSAPSVNLNEGFLVEDDNPSLERINSDTPPGDVTLLELFTPPPSQPLNSKDRNSELMAVEESSSQVRTISMTQSTTLLSSQSQPSQASSSSSLSTQSFFSQPSQSQSSPEFLHPEAVKAMRIGQSTCNVCYARVKDSAFIHNKIAHQYCCYTCADKILKRDGKCPICRERVFRVVKVIVV